MFFSSQTLLPTPLRTTTPDPIKCLSTHWGVISYRTLSPGEVLKEGTPFRLRDPANTGPFCRLPVTHRRRPDVRVARTRTVHRSRVRPVEHRVVSGSQLRQTSCPWRQRVPGDDTGPAPRGRERKRRLDKVETYPVTRDLPPPRGPERRKWK